VLQSAAGAPGTLPARYAPRAVLQQSHPPRRACESLPIASRLGPWSPSRRPSLERGSHLPRRTAVALGLAVRCLSSCQARRPRFARAFRGSRPTPQHPRRHVPAAAPAFKGRRTAFSRPASARRCPARSRAPPPLALVVAVQCLLVVLHGLPNFPSATAPPPRPEPCQTEPHRGQPPWAPAAGRSPVLPHTSTATNRSMVSPSTFSTHPPAESPPEWLNSGEPRRPAAPGTTLQNRSFFRGSPCNW
jgi:hypothetical protein